jgi:hypothetical protein
MASLWITHPEHDQLDELFGEMLSLHSWAVYHLKGAPEAGRHPGLAA